MTRFSAVLRYLAELRAWYRTRPVFPLVVLHEPNNVEVLLKHYEMGQALWRRRKPRLRW
jgi:hypothetical protein